MNDAQLLAEVAREFLDNASSSARMREVVREGGAADEMLTRRIADLGWYGIEVPEEFGGGGGDVVALATILQALGNHATPVPFLGSTVLCAGAILAAGTGEQRERWLPALAAGTTHGAALLPDLFGGGTSRTGALDAGRRDGRWVVSGGCEFVLDARGAGLLVAAAREPGGGLLFAVLAADQPGVRRVPQPMADWTRCVDTVELDGVVVEDTDVLARHDDAERLAEILVNRAGVAAAADALGGARRALSLTVTYAGQRQQFGRLIGSFQAVKHQAANAFVEIEAAQALVDDAAAALRLDPASAGAAASMAKEYACDVASRAVGTAIQLHGGIGYTWEHDLHFHLKRCKLDEALFGSARWHRERVAAALLAT